MSTSLKEMHALFASELYLYFHEDVLDEKRTKKECEFIEKCCDIKHGHKILDLACGHGRHANYFAAKHFDVCGIDINKAFIEIAKKVAKAKNINAKYIEQNILNIDCREEFDTVLLLFNSLGFFDKNDCKKLIGKIYNSLKIGGKVFIDTKNRDHINEELVPCSIEEKNGDLMIDRVTFNPKNGTTTNKRIYIKDGKRYDAPFTMRVYNYTELIDLINEFGFKINQTWGSWKGEEFNRNSRRVILILEKI